MFDSCDGHIVDQFAILLLFQLTYSMTRFAMYESVKKQLTSDGSVMPLYQKIGTAAVAGATGGFVGTPADLINVRCVKVRTCSHGNGCQ